MEGASTITTEPVVYNQEPLQGIWLQREERSPVVRLVANRNYWDTKRGPHVREVVFRNDIPPEQALDLVCDTEGEVDLVTELRPQDAARVKASAHANLVSVDALRVIVGVFNRDAVDLRLDDLRARQALNHAINRDQLIRETMCGHAEPLGSLMPPQVAGLLNRPRPFKHDPNTASALWAEAGGANLARPLRIAAPEELERMAEQVAGNIREALGVETEVTIYRGNEAKLESRRLLALRVTPRPWDILLHAQAALSAEGPATEIHRAFVGESGEWRTGLPSPEFDALLETLVAQTNPLVQGQIAHQLDKWVYDNAMALFLCAPHTLYAVNKNVDFTAYRTSFELAECKVNDKHWSRRAR